MRGRLSVITGPMFSGKTTGLFNEYDRARKNGTVLLFKPSLDDRYSESEVVTHEGIKRKAICCKYSCDMLGYIVDSGCTDVFIDEVQFFEVRLIEHVNMLLDDGVNVWLAFLNQDHTGKPFQFKNSGFHVGELMALADDILLLSSTCTVCGGEASKTIRKIGVEGGVVVLGGSESYEARCNKHFER